MKVLVQIEISHDTLAWGTLLAGLPQALQSVAVATGAGIAETGPDGMLVSPPGSNGTLAKVHFKLRFEDTGVKIADLPQVGEHAP